MNAKKITNRGFLAEFMRRHTQLTDRPFCFILGSGASKQSGIPTGGELVSEWLRELHELEDDKGRTIEQWATAENLGIKGFDYKRAATFYPQIYQRRFRDYKEQGYAFLETAFDGKEPSFGYSVLAQILATTRHKIAITTNFDNLIADALAIYMRIYPFVCGHESLTGYIRSNPRRPLVAKIHRDLLLQPKSNPEEIAKLPREWSQALTKICQHFTPIVIGYGGNDGSLMSFLETVPTIEGGIFWCHREDSKLDPRVYTVVTKHPGGGLVPIAGFDELMLQLQEQLKLPSLLPEMEKRQKQRILDYQKQFELLTAAARAPGKTPADEAAKKPVREAAEAAVERLTKEKDWWAWELKAKAESDPSKRVAIYRDGMRDFPKSAELMCNLANLLAEVLKEHDEAEKLYLRAIELVPKDPDYVGNFAWFMHNIRENYNDAERLYHKALELDPAHANNIGNFACFTQTILKNYDETERLYKESLALDPMDAEHTGNFALFMETIRKNYNEAERLYRKALKLDPNNKDIRNKFKVFLRKRNAKELTEGETKA